VSGGLPKQQPVIWPVDWGVAEAELQPELSCWLPVAGSFQEEYKDLKDDLKDHFPKRPGR
jgi:hypothetical protein